MAPPRWLYWLLEIVCVLMALVACYGHQWIVAVIMLVVAGCNHAARNTADEA